MLDLAREQGAATSSTYGQLRERSRERRVKVRGQDLTAEAKRADRQLRERTLSETERHNRATERKGVRSESALTPAERRQRRNEAAAAAASIDEAASWVQRLEQMSLPSSEIRAQLRTGGEVEIPTDGGTPRRIKFPKFSKLTINAAFDIHARGYLSDPNVRALAAETFLTPRRLRELRPGWVASRRGRVRRPPVAAGPGRGKRPT